MTSMHQAASPLRYQNIARIGRGGMAEVWLAVMRSNGVVKLAVLKYLWPELAEDPDLAELFLDEARLCARLGHPNLVQTFEVLHQRGRLAMAMEYLDGQPLTRVLNRLGSGRELTLAARLRIVTNMLSALDYAHELRDYDGRPLGLVHRDVSPHNVFVTYDGHVKLLDFGVAKSLVDQHHTRPGGFRGKIAYLAPECFRGGEIDRRADIFSAGIVLWEILAGQRFWKGASESTIAWNLATGAPPRQLPPELDVPDALRAVCLRALDPDPAARYQTAAELAAELARFAGEPDDAHARQLGQLVAGAFAGERAERQALIEGSVGHLAPESAPAPPTLSALRNRRTSRALTLITATVAAALALIVGSYVGHQASAWSDSSPWIDGRNQNLTGTTTARAAPRAVPEIRPVVEPIRIEAPAREPRSRRAHRAIRPRPLDLTSDEVLGLDGEPLADR
jgi:serine/threonine-protein kinase